MDDDACGMCGRPRVDLGNGERACPNHTTMGMFEKAIGADWETIPSWSVMDLQKTVESLNKRAQRLGLTSEPLVLTIGPERVIFFPAVPPAGNPFTGQVYTYGRPARHIKFTAVRVTGDRVQLNGWEPIAKVEPVDDGVAFIHKLSTRDDVTVPDEYRALAQESKNPACQHCGLNRPRKLAYIIHKPETGEWKQVGSTCLVDYTGHPNAEALASLAADMRGLLDVPPPGGDYDPDEYYGGRERVVESWPVGEFLAFVSAAEKKWGWVSRESQRDRAVPAQSTVDRVLERLTSRAKQQADLVKAGKWFYPAKDDYARADATREEVLGIFASRKAAGERLNDFEYNLHTSLNAGVVTESIAPTVAALYAVAEKYKTRAEADAEETARRMAQSAAWHEINEHWDKVPEHNPYTDAGFDQSRAPVDACIVCKARLFPDQANDWYEARGQAAYDQVMREGAPIDHQEMPQ